MCIRDRLKYVHFAALPPLLFDIANDPHAQLNLADDPAYTEVALDYARKLLDWRLSSGGRQLTNMSAGVGGMFARK